MPRPRTKGAVNQDDLPNKPDEDFDQGRGDGPHDDDEPPTPEDPGMGASDGPSIDDDAQMEFGEIALNIEGADKELWDNLEARMENQAAHKAYLKAERDIKKALVYDGVDRVYRAGHHKIKITATAAGTSEIKFTRGAGHRTHFSHDE